jgi:hypothetical protein
LFQARNGLRQITKRFQTNIAISTIGFYAQHLIDFILKTPFNMYKDILLLSCLLTTMDFCAQNTINGKTQLNAGIGLSQYGMPVYVGLDFGVHPDISIGVEGSYRRHTNSNFNANLLGISGNINYHFNSLLKIKSSDWDIYAGATLGYWIWNWDYTYPGANSSGVGFSGQVGGRYFFNPKWAINLETGGGTLTGGKLGVTHRF